jgi:peptide/nickel transport system permease protein
MAMSIIISIPLGVVAAVRKGTLIDSIAQSIALFGQSIPSFWFGILLIWIFAVGLGWFPTSGDGSVMHLILPAIAIAWFQIAALTRLTRSAMLEVLDAEYIKLARAKGVSQLVVVWKHALRNAAIVPLTYFGVLAGSVLTGSVVIETVFSWPGLGWIAIEAIRARDFPVVQSVVIIFAVIFILMNLIVDILYVLVDPRIRTR